MIELSTPRVLLVEGDESVRELMAEALAAAGYLVMSVASGREGLQALAENSVDALVTDLGMPGMGGIEVARAAKEIAPTVPVVVLVGKADREQLGNAHNNDVDAVLLKPVDPDTLSMTMGVVVQSRAR